MRAMAVVLTLALWLSAGAALASAQGGTVTINGTVADANTGAAVVGATVSVSGSSGTATTDARGNYQITGLEPGTYTVTFTSSGYKTQSQSTGQLFDGETYTLPVDLDPLPGAVTGVVGDLSGPLYGMQLTLQGGPFNSTYYGTSGPGGTVAFTDLGPGSYQFAVVDGTATVPQGTLIVNRGATVTANAQLGPPRVPGGTTAQFAARDLGYLNGERARLGLPAGIALNARWSTECAAHDLYMHDNHVIQHPEDPSKPGASGGGAWAGMSSVLSEGARWVKGANPWENAPIHLDQLLSPSLSVIGVDDSHGYQCATTFPGMLRAPTATDTIYTYPGDRSHGFATSENANEAPFVPGQFVGIPLGRTAGRELFVYLNRAGTTGQAQVKIVRASLSTRHHQVALRWVDNSTHVLGPYLAGGILIPVKPLRGSATYHASVTVADGSGTLTKSWTFTTAAKRRHRHHR